MLHVVFFFQAEDGIRDLTVTGVQTCALPISVSSSGSGCDTIDIEACTRAGVAVMNQSGGNADSVAEMAIGLMLSVLRRINESDRLLRAPGRGFSREDVMGHELRGRTLGLDRKSVV